MTSWITDERFLTLAIETNVAGHPVLDRVLSIALALRTPGHPDHPVRRTWLVEHPLDVRIPQEVTDHTGIGTQQLALFGQRPMTVFAELADLLEKLWRGLTPLVVFDAPYVLTVLDHEIGRVFPGQGLDLLQHGPVLDVLCLDRVCNPRGHGIGNTGATLRDLCAEYGVALSHRHDVDRAAVALGDIITAQAFTHPPLVAFDSVSLASSQVGWHRDYCLRTARVLEQRNQDDQRQPGPFERVHWGKEMARLRESAYAWPMHTRDRDHDGEQVPS